MRRWLIAAAMLATALPCAAEPDPLAPGRAGKTLCMSPDVKAKTCRAMIRYSFGPGDAVKAKVDTLVTEGAPPIVMRREDESRLRGGALCHRLAAADIDDAQFLVAGKAVGPDEARDLRSSMKRQYADLIGKEFCSLFTPDGAGLKVGSRIDGKVQADIVDRAVWVDAAAGYRVGT